MELSYRPENFIKKYFVEGLILVGLMILIIILLYKGIVEDYMLNTMVRVLRGLGCPVSFFHLIPVPLSGVILFTLTMTFQPYSPKMTALKL